VPFNPGCCRSDATIATTSCSAPPATSPASYSNRCPHWESARSSSFSNSSAALGALCSRFYHAALRPARGCKRALIGLELDLTLRETATSRSIPHRLWSSGLPRRTGNLPNSLTPVPRRQETSGSVPPPSAGDEPAIATRSSTAPELPVSVAYTPFFPGR